jgi:hypothetical protein
MEKKKRYYRKKEGLTLVKNRRKGEEGRKRGKRGKGTKRG